ncbi:MAG: hypothetical protein HYY03_01100 [Chloroflexi bacterium]|nr:hypothetical protein [Chloroflexota bacterium]
MSEESPVALEAKPRWYASPWVMLAAGYVFPPLGLFLMWRYRSWSLWVKGVVTALGSALAVISTYVSLRLL